MILGDQTSHNAVSGPDGYDYPMSERDRIAASPVACNGLPTRDCCREATICQRRASWTSPILTDWSTPGYHEGVS